ARAQGLGRPRGRLGFARGSLTAGAGLRARPDRGPGGAAPDLPSGARLSAVPPPAGLTTPPRPLTGVQGSTSRSPRCAKPRVLRVARTASLARQIPAICASTV